MTDSIDASLAALERSITPEAAIAAFLHDPPDKALDIRTHQSRAARYLSAVLDEATSRDSIKADSALGDQLAAIAERLPMPSAGKDGERAVGPKGGKLRVHHPLCGTDSELHVPAVDEAKMVAAITDLCSGIACRRALFRLLWRLLPERMAALDPAYARLPADTRVPDHTLWHHADTVTAFAAAVGATGRGDHALLSFAISPVQSFIAGARSLRDLRNGSLLLSWLAFRAMRPVIERIGPAALIFPSLRGNALMDGWLRGDAGGLGSKLTRPGDARLLAPSLPNRFLALVPAGPDGAWADALAEAVERAGAAAWQEVAGKVRGRLGRTLDAAYPGWDARWASQIEQTWDFVAAILPFRELGTEENLARLRGKEEFGDAYPEAKQVRGLACAIREAHRPGYAQDTAGLWQARVDIAARMLEAARTVRQVPRSAEIAGDVPAKCSLLGTWEQMGPAERSEAKAFWETVAKKESVVRKGEALCAVALVKRFAMTAHLVDELGLEDRAPSFADTATLAARPWLSQKPADLIDTSSRDWNGQWLHWAKLDADSDEDACPDDVWRKIRDAKQKLGPPPSYYAVLMLDGDNMGDWLAGRNSPAIRAAIHPDMVQHFGGHTGLDAKRPVSPSLHAAISEALGNFAQYVAPAIVAEHQGELIYAGGDDVLALLPTQTVLACANALKRAFRGETGCNAGAPEGFYRVEGRGDLLMMGTKATASVGIAVVHYKEDLRAALEMAREAERAAKKEGRDRVCLTVARRSGEHASATVPWALVSELAGAVTAFAEASDRWAYRMRALLPVFANGGPPEAAFLAELNRQLKRAEDEDTRELRAAEFYQHLRKDSGSEDWHATATRLITLWQSASFLARGRDVAGRT